MSQLIATGITLDKPAKELGITWNDGHSSSYPFSLLRYGCPCEECRGGHDQMSGEPPREIYYMPVEDTPSTRLEAVDAVGTYGIMISWQDGHNFGIYPWQYLRAMCPCPICREMMIYGK